MAAQGLIRLRLFLIAIQTRSAGLGTWLRRRLVRDAPPRAEATSLVTDGILGLAAFVLALALSFGTGRMPGRRTRSLEDANAIGTAWLQATALPDPRAASMASRQQDHTQTRLDFASANCHCPDIATLTKRTDGLRAQIWAEVTALHAARTDPSRVSLMKAINDVFATATSERWSLSNGMPPRLVDFLVAMVCISAALAGFQMGLPKQRMPVLFGLLFMVWSGVIATDPGFGALRLDSFRTVREQYIRTISRCFLSPPRVGKGFAVRGARQIRPVSAARIRPPRRTNSLRASCPVPIREGSAAASLKRPAACQPTSKAGVAERGIVPRSARAFRRRSRPIRAMSSGGTPSGSGLRPRASRSGTARRYPAAALAQPKARTADSAASGAPSARAASHIRPAPVCSI